MHPGKDGQEKFLPKSQVSLLYRLIVVFSLHDGVIVMSNLFPTPFVLSPSYFLLLLLVNYLLGHLVNGGEPLVDHVNEALDDLLVPAESQHQGEFAHVDQVGCALC